MHKWFKSSAKKVVDGVEDEDLLRYVGDWGLTEPDPIRIAGDFGLQLKSAAAHSVLIRF